MSYTNLKKQFVINEEKANELYANRINSDSCEKLSFSIYDNQTFYMNSNDVAKLTYSILKNDKKISEGCRDLPQIALRQYSRKCMIDEIVQSNKIEGVNSSRKEIDDVLKALESQSEKKGKKMRFYGIVSKYFKLSGGEPVPLDNPLDIRKIYDEIVLEEVVEENPHNYPDGRIFRKNQATVYDVYGNAIHNGLMPEENIIKHMEELLQFLKDEKVEDLHRICIFHYVLEYIHPFYDGNGRLGRFIMSYCLSRLLAPIMAYRLSWTILNNISDYYAAFKLCNDPRNKGDLTPFLITMLSIIYNAQEELKKSLQEKKDNLNYYAEKISKLPNYEHKKTGDMYNYLLQASLFSPKGISRRDLMSILNISTNTLKRQLDFLDNKGILVRKKNRNACFYSLDLKALENY